MACTLPDQFPSEIDRGAGSKCPREIPIIIVLSIREEQIYLLIKRQGNPADAITAVAAPPNSIASAAEVAKAIVRESRVRCPERRAGCSTTI